MLARTWLSLLWLQCSRCVKPRFFLDIRTVLFPKTCQTCIRTVSRRCQVGAPSQAYLHTHTHRGQIDGGWFLMSDSVDTSPPPSSCPVYYHRFTTHWITLDVPVWVMYYCRRRTLAKTGKKSHILSLLLERMCVIIFFKWLNEQNEQVWYEEKKLFRCSFAESLYLALESLIPIGQKASINFLLQQKMNPTLIQPRITGAITH